LDSVVKHVINAVITKQPLSTFTQPFEVQIFGKLDVATDVEKIYVAPSVSKQVKDNVVKFSKNTGVPHEFITKPTEKVKKASWFGKTSYNKGNNLVDQVLETIKD